MNVDNLPAAIAIGLWIANLGKTLNSIGTNQQKYVDVISAFYKNRKLRKQAVVIGIAGILVGMTPASMNLKWICMLAIPAATTLQIGLIAIKEKKLDKLIREHHVKTSVCGIQFGFEKIETQIQFWFKETLKDWPPTRLEMGINSQCVEVTAIPPSKIDSLLPIMRIAFETEKGKNAIQEAHKHLQAGNVTHPIDIQGWNHSTLTKELIDKIFWNNTNTNENKL